MFIENFYLFLINNAKIYVFFENSKFQTLKCVKHLKCLICHLSNQIYLG